MMGKIIRNLYFTEIPKLKQLSLLNSILYFETTKAIKFNYRIKLSDCKYTFLKAACCCFRRLCDVKKIKISQEDALFHKGRKMA